MATTATLEDASRPEHTVLLEDYRRYLETTRSLSPPTVRNYLTDVGPFIEYLGLLGVTLQADAGGLKELAARAGEDEVHGQYRRLIRDYVSWLIDERQVSSGRDAGARGHGRASVIRMLVALRSFARYLVERDLIPDSPLWQPHSTMMRRYTPRAPRRLPDVLSAKEAERLLAAPSMDESDDPKHQAASMRDTALLELLYGGGLRVSEIAGLDVRDVSLGSRTARVWGKGSKARMVPLGKPAVEAISRYVSAGRSLLEVERSGDALFLNQRGGRLTPRSIQTMVQRYAGMADVRTDIHPHTLRHSFATHLLDGGADLRIVQELLGHSTPAATQVYTHVSQSEARKVYLSSHPLARGGSGTEDDAADGSS